ncbi:MAG TPA: bacterioferritin [Methylomirabilota bacterium]|nr:bacterioferritin [Methylomirabilota bacterium]
MQGDPRIIDLLNQVLRKELTGINQYFIHSRMCKNWGYAILAKHGYDESIDEMKHADTIIERVLFLDGVPNLSDYDPILIGADVRQQFANDLSLEMAALQVLRPGVQLCLEVGDHASRELLERS